MSPTSCLPPIQLPPPLPRTYHSLPHRIYPGSQSPHHISSAGGCTLRSRSGTPTESRGWGSWPPPGLCSAPATRPTRPCSPRLGRRPTAGGCSQSCCTETFPGGRRGLGSGLRHSRPHSRHLDRRQNPEQYNSHSGTGIHWPHNFWGLHKSRTQKNRSRLLAGRCWNVAQSFSSLLCFFPNNIKHKEKAKSPRNPN